MTEATKEPALEKKFKLLTDDFVELPGTSLKISALTHFGNVKAGEVN